MINKSFYKLFNKSDFAVKLYSILGFYPKNEAVYKQAFTHRSSDNTSQKTDSNERLEFLGDAVLGQIVAIYLFKKFPKKSEGELTKLRSKLVNRKLLNDIALKIGLEDFVDANLNSASKTIYGNALEALIGAIYLDQGYYKTKSFVVERMFKYFVNVEEVIQKENDYKSKLMEMAQKKKWDIIFDSKPYSQNNKKYFKTTLFINNRKQSEGLSTSKKQAEQKAAQKYFEHTNK